MKQFLRCACLVCLLGSAVFMPAIATAGMPGIVVSIKPLHSWVQAIVGDTANLQLLVQGAHSPHHYHLKPSQLKALHKADVVFYIDDHYEFFLNSALASLPASVKKIADVQTPLQTPVSYTHLRAHETGRNLVCRLLLEKKK